MSLVRNVGTIGGLTAVSRVFGFARDMLLARVLGAGLAADAWQLAFTLPNTFRRLFAEGAFSVAFVPMYTRRLHGAEGEDEVARRQQAADDFASDVLVGVRLGAAGLFGAVHDLPCRASSGCWRANTRTCRASSSSRSSSSRITFPYLGLVSLVAMLSGVLNARSRFAPGAFVPVLLNLVMIAGILTGWYCCAKPDGGRRASSPMRWRFRWPSPAWRSWPICGGRRAGPA